MKSTSIASTAAGLVLLVSCRAIVAGANRPATEIEEPLEAVRSLVRDGAYALAQANAESLLVRVEAAYGADSLETAAVLHELVEAERLAGMLAHVPGLEHARRALDIRERRLGADHAEVASSLVRLGRMLTEYGKAREARGILERALSLRESIFGADAPEVADALEALGSAIEQTGAVSAARPLKQRALRIDESAYGRDDPRVAADLQSLGVNFGRNGDYDDARPVFQRALEMRERLLGPEHPEVATTLSYLGVLAFDTGDGDAAKEFHERARAIREKRLGAQHPQLGRTHENLGNLARGSGNLAAAVEHYERALSILENALGKEHPELSRTLTNLGGGLAALGDERRALRLYERALEVAERAYGPDNPRVANTLNDLGNLRRKLADYQGARDAYERSLAIYERLLGSDNIEVTWPLRNLAGLLAFVGDFETARRHYARSHEIRSKTYGAENPLLLDDKRDLAGMMFMTGDIAGAKSLYEAVLAAEEEAYGSESLDLPFTLIPLADIFWEQGDEAGGEKLIRRAIVLEERRYGKWNPMLAGDILRLARFEARSGRTREAMDDALRVAQIVREHVRLTTAGLSEREALRFAAVRRGALDLVLSLALKSGRPSDVASAIDAIVRTRAIVLDEMSRRNSRPESDPEIVALAEQLDAARTRLAKLMVRPPDDTAEKVAELLREARDKRDRAERALAERSGGFRVELTRDRAGLDDVIEAMPLDSALVGFARFNRQEIDPTRKGATGWHSVPAYVAYVAEPGRTPTLVDLGPAEKIDDLVSQVQSNVAGLASAPSLSVKRATRSYLELGSRLRTKIWDPVWRGRRYVARALVVPDGALSLVNFAALPSGGSTFLVEQGPLLHYLSAERDLITPEDRRTGTGLLAIGDPDFDAAETVTANPSKFGLSESSTLAGGAAAKVYRGSRSACGSFSTMRFQPLPASSAEVASITAVWNRLARARTDSEIGIDLTGAAASEEAFKRLAPGRRVLHVATHGFFVGGICPSVVDRAEKAAVNAVRTILAGENPLILSGLAFAGANRRDSTEEGQEDGILTAEEVGALDLRGVEWAVLSACETGVGEVRVGEGVLGLRRALRIAGVRTVLMSLWPVEDEAAKRWMRELYEAHFERDRPTADAVRDASLAVLAYRRSTRQSTHPFFWAPFVAAGN